MNKQELNQSLSFIIEPDGELQTILYAVMSDSRLLMLDVKNEDLNPIGDIFVNYLCDNVINKDDINVLPLSSADNRNNCFYEYDLQNRPPELQTLTSVIGNRQIDNFDFRNTALSEISAIIIVLGDNSHQVVLYKSISAVEIIGRGGFMLWKANQRLERFDDQMLRISSKAQVLYVRGSIIVLDLNILEKSFGFHEIIKSEAAQSLNAISEIGIVNNMEALEELLDDVSFARKLSRVAQHSPVLLNHIPNTSIISFSETHPALKGKMKYTPDKTQFVLDTKVSKNLLIKLLNDDYLTSELTRLYYDSLAKDNVE